MQLTISQYQRLVLALASIIVVGCAYLFLWLPAVRPGQNAALYIDACIKAKVCPTWDVLATQAPAATPPPAQAARPPTSPPAPAPTPVPAPAPPPASPEKK